MRILDVTPAPCMICGRGNTPDAHGDRPRFVDLERDVNWNDPAIICEDDVMRLGGMMGMLSEDARKELTREIARKEKQLHDKDVEIDSMKRRAKRLGIRFELAAE